MPKLSPDDLARLDMIERTGGGRVHIVMQKDRVEDRAAVALARWADRMCGDDYMRLERYFGVRNRPSGEWGVDYVLTGKARGAIKRYLR